MTREEALQTIQDYLDWEYALHGMFETVEYHRQLLAEGRHKPTLTRAREAIAYLRSEEA